MITVEQWGEYKAWVKNKNDSILESNRRMGEIFRNNQQIHKFLWWTWQSSERRIFVQYQEFIRPTIEGCLDYLLQKNENTTNS